MKCPNCGYNNPIEGTKDNRCDQCGYLLSKKDGSTTSFSVEIIPEQFISTDSIVIATFNHSLEANLAQEVLQEQGIESWLEDEATVSFAWHLTIAVGWIKLKVREQDAKLAREILNEYQASFSELSRIQIEEESLPEPTFTDEIVRRAFRAAFLGLLFLPLQLYSLWLLINLFWKGAVLKRRHIFQIINTLGLDMAILIVIFSLIQIAK